MKSNTRRDFLKKSVLTGVGLIAIPEILKKSSYAAGSPNKLIQFAQIGCGREGTVDYAETMKHSDLCWMVAVDDKKGPLWASKDNVLYPRIGPEGRIWMPSPDHYRNWLESIISRKDPIAPVDQSTRSLEACALSWIGMKLNRKLKWDAKEEKFIGDKEANSMLERKSRKPEYDVSLIMKKNGLA